jgi:hypothetical protein
MELALLKTQADAPRDPLFGDDGEAEATTPLSVQTTMDVMRMVQAIRELEKRIELFTLQEQESRAFYGDKKRRCEEQAGRVKAAILGFLKERGLKNIQTPAGTAYQRTLTQRQWPEDATLLAWAATSVPRAIRVKQELDKRIAADHIHTTGEIPQGYREWEEVRLYLR